jgi:hypothetical protein
MHRNLAVATAIGAIGLGIIIAQHHGPHEAPAFHAPVAPPTNSSVQYDPCVQSAWMRLRRMCGETAPMAQCLMDARSTIGTAACCDDVDKLALTCHF